MTAIKMLALYVLLINKIITSGNNDTGKVGPKKDSKSKVAGSSVANTPGSNPALARKASTVIPRRPSNGQSQPVGGQPNTAFSGKLANAASVSGTLSSNNGDNNAHTSSLQKQPANTGGNMQSSAVKKKEVPKPTKNSNEAPKTTDDAGVKPVVSTGKQVENTKTGQNISDGNENGIAQVEKVQELGANSSVNESRMEESNTESNDNAENSEEVDEKILSERSGSVQDQNDAGQGLQFQSPEIEQEELGEENAGESKESKGTEKDKDGGEETDTKGSLGTALWIASILIVVICGGVMVYYLMGEKNSSEAEKK